LLYLNLYLVSSDQIINLRKELKSRSESKHKKFFKTFNNANDNNLTKFRKDLVTLDDFKKKLQENKFLNKNKIAMNTINKNPTSIFENTLYTHYNTTNPNCNKNESNFYNKNIPDNSNNLVRTIKTASTYKSKNNFNRFKMLFTDNYENTQKITRNIKSPYSKISDRLRTPKNDEIFFPNLKNFNEFDEGNKNKFFLNTYESKIQTEVNNLKSIDEREINHLLNYYYTNNDDGNSYENENKNEANYLLKKFNIENNENNFEEEEIKIKNLMKKNKKISNANEDYNKIFLKICNKSNNNYISVNSKTVDGLYKSPINSLKKINFNKNIFEKVSDVRNFKQIDMYMQNHLIENERLLKNMQMKNIKETVLNINTKNEDIYEIVSNDFDYLNDHFDLKSPLIKQMTRDIIFSKKLEFTVNYTVESKIKPFSRSQFSCSLDGNNLYMFGGISGEMLSELWICDLKSKIINFKFYMFIYR